MIAVSEGEQENQWGARVRVIGDLRLLLRGEMGIRGMLGCPNLVYEASWTSTTSEDAPLASSAESALHGVPQSPASSFTLFIDVYKLLRGRAHIHLVNFFISSALYIVVDAQLIPVG